MTDKLKERSAKFCITKYDHINKSIVDSKYYKGFYEKEFKNALLGFRLRQDIFSRKPQAERKEASDRFNSIFGFPAEPILRVTQKKSVEDVRKVLEGNKKYQSSKDKRASQLALVGLISKESDAETNVFSDTLEKIQKCNNKKFKKVKTIN